MSRPGVVGSLWRNPLLGALLIWIVLDLIRPSVTLRLPMISSIALLLGWLVRPKRTSTELKAMLVILAAAVVGGLFAVNSFSAFWVAYILVSILVVAFQIPHVARQPSEVRLVVLAICGSCLFVAAWAATHGGYGPAGAGGGQDENYTAASSNVLLAFAYFAFASARSWAWKLVFLGVAGVAVTAIVVGFSRGGFVGLLVVGAVCFWFEPRKLRMIALALLAAIALAVSAPASYWEDMRTIGDTGEATADHRIELWTIAWREFLSSPLVGVGPGNFKWNIARFQSEEQLAKYDRSLGGSAVAHSMYFEVLAELGGIGMIAMLVAQFAAVRGNLRLARRVAAREETLVAANPPRSAAERRDLAFVRAAALGTAGGLLGYLACSLFLSTTYYSMSWLLIGLSVALRMLPQVAPAGRLAAGAPVLAEPSSAPPPPRRTRLIRVGGAVR